MISLAQTILKFATFTSSAFSAYLIRNVEGTIITVLTINEAEQELIPCHPVHDASRGYRSNVGYSQASSRARFEWGLLFDQSGNNLAYYAKE